MTSKIWFATITCMFQAGWSGEADSFEASQLPRMREVQPAGVQIIDPLFSIRKFVKRPTMAKKRVITMEIATV
jgi:hypothetical protein